MRGRLGPPCPVCGTPLWKFQFDAAGPGEHEPPRWLHVAVCPRCDRPPVPDERGRPQGVMLPRRVNAETGEPVPPPSRRDPARMNAADWGLLIGGFILIVGLAVRLWQVHPLLALIPLYIGIVWARSK